MSINVRTYVAAAAAIAVSAAQDVFEIVAPSDKTVHIREIAIGQYSDPGDAQAEMLSVRVLRGYTTSGSGGSSMTPAPLESGGAAATSTVERNNTTVAQDGTAVELRAEAFNVMAGWRHYPVPEERITLAPSERLAVRITAPADALTMNITLVFDEIG